MAEGESPRSLLLRLGKPSLTPNSTEEGHILKLASMCVAYMAHRMLEFIRTFGSEPICMTYQSDCTPNATTERITVSDGACSVTRAGGRTGEYLLHRLFAKSSSNRQCCLFGPPQRLGDKTVMTHVNAAAQGFLLYPFRFGCRCINIFHVSFDGALHEPLSSALHRHHSKAVAEEMAGDDSVEGTMLTLLSWFCATPCMSHSCHNALKWALKGWVDDRSRMKDIWACVASLRSSFGSFQSYIVGWISARLKFADDEGEGSWPDAVWHLLGCDTQMCEQLHDLELRWSAGALVVAGRHRDSASLQARVHMLMLRFFRVSEWSDSRWLGASRTSRQMLGAIMMGIEDFVQFAIGGGHSTYHLSGFMRLDASMKLFFVQAAVGGHPMEACLRILFEDDRLLLAMEELERDMAEAENDSSHSK